MTKTYAQVMKQIESLKSEAENLRRKEVDGVVRRIKDAIDFYGLTAADLGLGAPGARRAVRKRAAKPAAKTRRSAGRGTARAARYRDEQGNTWGGRGPRPRWLREALASGKSLQDFEVRGDAA
jgi:DNA-binding protein H-NS